MSGKLQPNYVLLKPGRALTLSDEVVSEAGKSIFDKAIGISTDFCKNMITISSGAVAIYLGLLKLTVPEKYVYGPGDRLSPFLPVLLFLASMLAFVVGYLPILGTLDVNSARSISGQRGRAILIRCIAAYAGFLLLLLGIGFGAWAILTRP